MPSSRSFSSAVVGPSVAAPRPLLSLRRTSAEANSGLPSHCAASVRLLDRVSLSVGAGDCVVVQHRDPAGVRVLLAALAGVIRQPSVILRGTRIVRAGVRIRRASIRADLVPTLVAAWRARGVVSATPATPAVHVLRASRGGVSDGRAHQAWTAWAAAQRVVGGALVIVVDEDATDTPSPMMPPRIGPPGVHEPSPIYRDPDNDEARTARAVRACRLRHGRIVAAPSVRTPPRAYWPSDAAGVFGP